MKKLFRSIKYKIKKFYLLKLNSSDRLKVEKLNDEQKKGLNIFKTLAVQPDSEILMAPISGKYYIRNEEIFIVLDINRLSVINSVYHYDIYYNETETRYLAGYIRRIIERRREKLEEKMRSKIDKSLSHLESDVKIKFNKKGED
jgi:hypothetical protein